MIDPKKLTTAEAAELTDQIASLTRSELPLVPGLLALGEEYPDGALRRSMLELAGALESGIPLEKAIQDQGDRFSPQIRGLIRAGLRTGRLGDLLGRFSACTRIGTELRHRLLVSLIYPVFSIVIAFAIFSLLSMVLVPMFESIFRDFGLPVPRITLFLFEISRIFQQAWPLLLVLLTIGVVGWASGFLLAPLAKRSVGMSLPIVGGVWRSTTLAEYFHLLAILLEGGVPISEAVRLTGGGVGKSELETASGRVAQNLDSGRGFADSMALSAIFPTGFVPLLKWAEKLDSLPEVLHIIAEMLETRAKDQLLVATSLIGFLSVLFITVGVFIVILGLLVPMITLVSKLSG